jgi:hypothetical protein
MKKVMLLLSLVLIGYTTKAQNQKYIIPSFFIEAPIERGYLVNGLNFGAGAIFGDNSPFVAIGVYVGYLTYQPYTNVKNEPILQKGTITMAFDIKTKTRLLIMPAFVVGTNGFYDLNIKFGYSVDKEKTMFATVFASQTYNIGIGFVTKIR